MAEEEAPGREPGATGEEPSGALVPVPDGAAAGDEPEDEPPQGAASWSTFSGSAAVEERDPSPLEKLLDLGADCSVEQLLDEDDFLKEFQSGHARLREHLCGPAAVCALVRCVSADPPEDWPDEARLRRPYVAGEALAVGCEQLCDALVRDDAPLDLLWGFLDADPEGPDAPGPALAGYFSGCAAALVARRPPQVADHLRRWGPERLLGRLLAWLGHRSAAELLAALLCADDPARTVFPAAGLVQRLVGCLEGEASHLPHLALVVDALLARACRGDICDASVFLDELVSPAVVGALVAYVIGGRGGGGGVAAAQAAADILSSAVAHLHALRRWDASSPGCMSPAGGDSAGLGDQHTPKEDAAQPARAHGRRLVDALCEQVPGLCGVIDAVASGASGEPPAGGPSPSEDAESSRALREAIVLLLRAGRAEAADAAAADANAEPRAPGEEEADWCGDPEAACRAELERALDALSGTPPPWTPASGAPRALSEEQAARMRELAGVCPALREALGRRGLPPPGAAGPGPGGLEELLADLRAAAQLRRRMVGRPLPAAGAVAMQVALLLALLAKTSHVAFLEAARGARALPRCLAALLACAWSSPLQGALWGVLAEFLGGEEGTLPAVLDLAGDAALMQRVVANVADEPDVGYMGFVRLLCSGLQKLGGSKPEVAAALSKISGWSDVIVRDLEDMERVCKEHLGGAPPDSAVSPTGGFDCLEAIRRTAGGAGDDAALSPEDVRDIVEEDVEIEEALEMFQIQRQRAAAPRQLTICP